VGVVRDAVIQYTVQHAQPGAQLWSMPIVAETYDGFLNDINGFHVKPENAWQALDGAHPGAVPEGNVGGGTGMMCNGFKGGIGTASRKITTPSGQFTVGVLVQCNYGRRASLRIAGVPVGQEITDLTPLQGAQPRSAVQPGAANLIPGVERELGSIIIVVATDAPL